MKKRKIALVALGLFALLGCGGNKETEPTTSGATETKLTGEIKVDGSSTVGPISSAIAEEFAAIQPEVRVSVSESGTGGGFKKFVRGEIDICDASRPIQADEMKLAEENSIEYIEIPVAYDGLTVVVNKDNTWCDTLTVDELKKIWMPGSTVKTWKDIRPEWPAEKIELFGAGQASGTFDYFTEAIVGEKKASRTDYQMSENDNDLVRGVIGNKNALGYFGYSYYDQNKDNLKGVKIDMKNGGIAPSPETVMDGTYQPLSRPLFIYISKKAYERPEVKAFVMHYFEEASQKAILDEGFITLPSNVVKLAKERFESGVTGTLFGGKEPIGLKIGDLMSKESGK